MRFRSTIAVDEDFAAVTRRHFSPLAAFAVFFLVTQIACVVVALLTLRGHDPEIAGSYGIDGTQDRAQDMRTDPGTVGSLNIYRALDGGTEQGCDPA
jgi:hypothetical protein